eukprot:CAMPEP_0176408284 /NCGR_PEP_ID=MMETSP0127-20121128/1870_1 /TAXON_ID=938130 /ORGANISM="Platyophrya macrostoma, Strain WH" /LENGTH=129 /DNA_ID=CAMNT_0017787561 /DNA_START=136 /DNA_END=526 /DNA_ORIENTATION=+
MYLFFCGMALIELLITFGTFWQNDITVSDFGVFPFVAAILLTVFLTVGLVLSFYAYKEFKALAMGYRPVANTRAASNADPSEDNYGAIDAIAVGQENPEEEPLNYSNEQGNNNNNNNNSSGFQASKAEV